MLNLLPFFPILATLRLLNLLNEPCRFLRDTVRNLVVHGSCNESFLLAPPPTLTSTHSGPVVWTGCLPQILDRLGHPDAAVRQCLLNLLSRLICMTNSDSLGNDRALANQLVFPAIVGSKGVDCGKLNASSLLNSNTKCYLSCAVLFFLHKTVQPDVRVQSHALLVATLCDAGYGTMVEQVSSFITEMRRVAILWEELWSGVLIQHVDDLTRRVGNLTRLLTESSPYSLRLGGCH